MTLTFPGIDLRPRALALRAQADVVRVEIELATEARRLGTLSEKNYIRYRQALDEIIAEIDAQIITV